MVSGIGPKDVLEEAGVDVRVDLPGVGQHIQDHMVRAFHAPWFSWECYRTIRHLSLDGWRHLGDRFRDGG